MQAEIILASSSPFRQQLLDRLQLDYEFLPPDIDEAIFPGEDASSYVCRLAKSKANRVAVEHPQAVVIGSDQCALLGEKILGKPGSHENALRQLREAQGKTVVFHTAVCVLNLSTGYSSVEDVVTEVEFRNLSDQQLDHYLRVEEPYQCAGSFKSEGYGSCLFKKIHGDDPTALIGLPLIRLTRMLENAGVEVV
ncbi:MAG: Maf family nucleotide pyrophosphatase [Gammaproteobacteria bacterium]|nr:Maf family nucleotide pyrophosphatase [Gammaproteobacteria bacterium]